jgi:PAS domain S-box-containing protein
LRRGYRSKAIVPLFEKGQTIGVMCAYSSIPAAFGSQEMTCLDELSKLLVCGLKFKQVEEKRRRDREVLALKDKAIETAVSGIVIMDRNLSISYVNPYALELLGFSEPESFIGRSAEDYIVKTETWKERYDVILAGGNWSGEMQLKTREGASLPVLASASSILSIKGRVEGIMVSFSDLTDLKETTEELERNKALYEGIVERERDLVCRFLPDTTLTFVNSTYCSTFACLKENLLGLPFSSLLTEQEAKVVRERIGRITPSNPFETYSHTVTLPTGEIRWFEWTDQGLFDGKGDLLELQSCGRDITDHFLVEEAARSKADLFEGLFENTHTPMLLIDASEARIIRANLAACEFYGYVHSDFEGMSLSRLNSLSEGKMSSILEECLKVPRIVQGIQHRIADGSLKDMEISTGPVEWEGKRVLHAILRDVTERNAAKKELIKRDELEILTTRMLEEFGFCKTMDEFNTAVEHSLAMLGAYANVDRAYLFLIEGQEMSNTHEWCAPGVTAQKEELQFIPLHAVPWWMDQLRSTGFIHIPEVEKLPSEANAEREMLEAQDISSAFVFAVKEREEILGFVGMDNLSKEGNLSEREFPLLSVIARILAKSLEMVKATEQLRESEARYQDIVEKQTDLIVRFKPDGMVTYCNEAFARYFGISEKELVGKGLEVFWPKDEIHRIKEYFATLTPENPFGNIQRQNYLPNGSSRWQLWADRAFFNELGILLEIQSVGRDITSEKTAMLEKDVQRKRLKVLFEN